ncbi:embryonic polarity protein dorsal-like [Aphidius gifuensis]|uniref:embryonic polarity protein dorsal-like n=1 Tax=Aphidius gifuensis TaxID=684658 RepID=UPI001CDD6B43|nr:embryonic polarity protein dorsal-like [Aphidius gifuensis]
MNNKKPFISIMEQPTSSMKFRYRCERRNNVIYGMNSTTATKTYPTIIINNCNGYQNGVLYISCVSEKETGGKYHMHPHKILKKDSAENCIGFRILKFTMNDNDNNFIFIECKNLCIEYTKKHDVEKVLESYERLKFDPFKAGFEHKDLSSKSIDPSSVRICFQAILTNTDEKKSIVLDPVVSTVIKNYVGKYKLKIYRLSRHSALATGGTELTLLCNKVSKNIRVLFYQKDNDDNIIWQRYAYIIDVYRQVAITIKTPEYNGLQFGIIKVFIQLVRKTDGVTSEPHKYSRLCGENNFGAIDLSITSKSHPRAVSLVSAASTQHGSNNRTNLKENETVTSGFYKVPSPNYGQHQLRHQQFVQQRQYGQLNFPSHHQQIINHHNLRMIQQNKNYTAQNVGEHNQQEFPE